MTNDEAYAVIAKHIFVAKMRFEGDRQFIVLADDIDEAERVAKRFFNMNSVFVNSISSTANPQVFEI